MTEELKTLNISQAQEATKTLEQQEKERIELLKLIETKEATFWENDYKDITVTELVSMIDNARLELKKEIVDKILEKYYDDCEINRDSNIFIEAPHGKLPNLAETSLILRQYEEFSELEDTVIEKSFVELGQEITSAISEDKTFIKIRSELKNKYKDDELKLKILNILAGNDVYVSDLARGIAGEEFNYTLPNMSRKRNDFTKKPGEREIVKGGKTKRLESGHGGALAQHYAIQQSMENNQGGEENMDKKFYHIALLERDSRKPFTIGVSPYKGEYSCDIEVAEFIAEELKRRLNTENVIKNNGDNYDVKVPGPGEKFNGSPVNRHRRLGKGKFKSMALGESYNFIQLGIPSLALKNYSEKIAKILKDILAELK